MSENYHILKGKTEITLPLLQRDLSLSYRETKEQLQAWVDIGLVDGTVRGLSYAINTQSVSLRELSESVCEQLVETISVREFEVLDSLEEAVGGRIKAALTDVDRLVSLGLIHEFVGRYFLSVSEESMARLRAARFTPIEIADDIRPIIALIAHPILLSCLDAGEDCPELMESSYLPSVCKTYIEDGLKRFRDSARRPKLEATHKELACIGKYEIIEVFASRCYFETKDEYCEAAESELSVIRSSEHCSTLFKRIASNATSEIVRKLSLEDLQEIHHFFLSKSEEDAD